MVNCCVANKCHNLSDKQSNIKFHRFPFNRPDILNKWIAAIRRENWKPTKTSKLCSAHFLETDYGIHPRLNRWLLKDDAVPTVFNLSSHLQKKTYTGPAPNERLVSVSEHESKQPTESSSCGFVSRVNTSSLKNKDDTDPMCSLIMDVDANIQSVDRQIYQRAKRCPPSARELAMRQRCKSLQQKVRRMTRQIANMQDMISTLQKEIKENKPYAITIICDEDSE